MRVLYLCVITVYLCAVEGEDLRALFKQWRKKFGREEGGVRNTISRFRQFQKSAATIRLINSQQDYWTADFTQFADMSEEEKRSYTGLNSSLDHTPLPESNLLGDLAAGDPVKQYWEMGPAQNQWFCGSCWAFAAIGALEGRHIKEHGEYREFSEQTLLDCTFEGRRDGCNGGWSDSAIDWTSENPHSTASFGYLPYRVDNPYRGDDGECVDLKTPYPNALRRAKPTATYGRGRNDAGLQHAIATEGPVLVSIYSSWALPFYSTGTYSGTGCGTNPSPNHAVVVAGYEKDYWYIKNSWGSWWGYSGYVYFSRYWENLCSIARWRQSITWNANKQYDICADTPPRDRTPCVDDVYLSQSECQARGCCFDPEQTGTKEQCFTKGMITIYDNADHRRVFYGSVADFTEVGFPETATSVRVDIGTWVVYGGAGWNGGPARILTPADGTVVMSVQSTRLLTSKRALHLFVHEGYRGNKFTVSGATDRLQYQFNNAVSSLVSYGAGWTVCDGERGAGPCQTVPRPEFYSEPKVQLCVDCISSVQLIQ